MTQKPFVNVSVNSKPDHLPLGGGRFFESVRLISDILEYIDDNNIEAVLSSADFKKEFYSIDHCFLFSVLKSFGFSPDFIQWVRTLFKNSESCVMNNYFPQGILHWKKELVKETLFLLTFSFFH